MTINSVSFFKRHQPAITIISIGAALSLGCLAMGFAFSATGRPLNLLPISVITPAASGLVLGIGCLVHDHFFHKGKSI